MEPGPGSYVAFAEVSLLFIRAFSKSLAALKFSEFPNASRMFCAGRAQLRDARISVLLNVMEDQEGHRVDHFLTRQEDICVTQANDTTLAPFRFVRYPPTIPAVEIYMRRRANQ